MGGRIESRIHNPSLAIDPGTDITGSGASGQVAFFNGSNSITSSADFAWDGTVLAVTGDITASGTIKWGDGTVSLPAGAFLSDPSSGFYLPGAGEIRVAAGGVNVARFLSNVQVLGVTANPFTVKGAMGDASGLKLYQDASDNSNIINNYSGSMLLGTNNTVVLTVTSSGNTIGGFRKDQDGKTAISIFNASGGASASAEVRLTNDQDDFRLTLNGSGDDNIANILANSGLGGLNIATLGADPMTFKTSNTLALTIDALQNIALGSGALATTATDGFLYIPTCAGIPTGTPTTKTGRAPIIYDSTNNKIMIYDGAWIGIVVS